jgi:hypothetical protein
MSFMWTQNVPRVGNLPSVSSQVEIVLRQARHATVLVGPVNGVRPEMDGADGGGRDRPLGASSDRDMKISYPSLMLYPILWVGQCASGPFAPASSLSAPRRHSRRRRGGRLFTSNGLEIEGQGRWGSRERSCVEVCRDGRWNVRAAPIVRAHWFEKHVRSTVMNRRMRGTLIASSPLADRNARNALAGPSITPVSEPI